MAQEEKLSLAEVTAIGIGGMIGGGSFAVLGLAISVSGHAVALSLAGGGVIALLTGLSYAHLGLRFRSDGGSFTYIEQAFNAPSVAGLAGWLLVIGYIGTIALYATAFGDYGAALVKRIHVFSPQADMLAAVSLLLFLAINLTGAKASGRVELSVVAAKLSILALFVVAGMTSIHASHFTPVFNHGIFTPVVAIALVFVAYEGFELIPNAVDEMENPERNLKRAIMLAIGITIVVYVLVALVALGNLTPAQIQHDQEYVLAVAATPTLGKAGFILIGIAALLSTSSTINATLFGAARLAKVMAAESHALPRIFSMQSRKCPVPYVALLILTALSILLSVAANLDIISTLVSVTFLLIFMAVNFSACRLSKEIGLYPLWPFLGGLLAAGSCAMLLWHAWLHDRHSLLWLCVFYGAVIMPEGVLVLWRGRRTIKATSPKGSS